MSLKRFDVIVVGGGAAGLMCAITAAGRGRTVAVLEHNDTVGKKIRISGGGRCNFTNLNASAERCLSANPHFAKSALARFTPKDFCRLVEGYRIPYHEKKLGQLFCDRSAQDIIDLLKSECRRHRVEIFTSTRIADLRKRDSFVVAAQESVFQSGRLVIATGGLSVPPLGATGFGYAIARQFDLKVTACRPGLVPLTFSAQDHKIFKELAGVSVDAIVCFKSARFRENILFTHKGLSGPAILQISSYWETGRPIEINLCPDVNLAEVLRDNHPMKTTLKNVLKDYLPARLVDVFCTHVFESKPLNQYSFKNLEDIAHHLHAWRLVPAGTEGYAKAEVTVGGIDTDELSSKTMEAKKVPGLFFIGEVVDVTGHLGGYNFQWAWASGYAAGQAV